MGYACHIQLHYLGRWTLATGFYLPCKVILDVSVIESDSNGVFSRFFYSVADMTRAIFAILEVHFGFAES